MRKNTDKCDNLVAVAAVLHRNREILLAKRPAGANYAGYWEFPGGKLEENEAPEAALRRELREELNVEAGALQPLTFLAESRMPDARHPAPYHISVLIYACAEFQGDAIGAEGQEIAWILPKQLAEYDLLPANIPLIPQIKAFLQLQTHRPLSDDGTI